MSRSSAYREHATRSLVSGGALALMLVVAACEPSGVGGGEPGDSGELAQLQDMLVVPSLDDLLVAGESRDPAVEEAVRGWLEAVAERPEDPQSWAELSEGLIANGLDSGALSALEGWLRLDSEEPRAWFQRALMHWEAGRVAAALDDLQHSLEAAPERSLSHSLLGTWRLELGEFDRALEAFDAAAACALGDPSGTYAVARAELGRRRVLLEAERYTDCRAARSSRWDIGEDRALNPLRAYDAFIEARAMQALGDGNAGDLLARIGVPQPPTFDPWIDALESYRVGVAARMAAALTGLREGRAAEVIAELEQLHAADPDDVTLQGLLIAALNGAQRSERALELLQATLEVRPEHYRVHMNLALTYNRLNNAEAALGAARRAVELHPDYLPARKLLASLARKQ